MLSACPALYPIDRCGEFAGRYVASGPLVRSSYRAGEFFIEAMIKKDAAERAAAA